MLGVILFYESCRPTKFYYVSAQRFHHVRAIQFYALVAAVTFIYVILVTYWQNPAMPTPPVWNAWVRAGMPPLVENTVTKLQRTLVVDTRESLQKVSRVEQESSKTQDEPERLPPKQEIFNQSYNAEWVHVEGPFTKRLHRYNTALANLRQEIRQFRGDGPWVPVEPFLRIFWCNGDDSLQQLAMMPEVRTLALSWNNWQPNMTWDSRHDKSNVLQSDYYPWSVSEPLCSYIKTPGRTKARWDAVYNRQCSSLPNGTGGAISLQPVYLHGKPINPRDYWPSDGNSYPAYFYTTPPPHVFHVHILTDAVVTGLGDVITGDLKLLPYACSHDEDPRPPRGHENTTLYDEVFIITQFWGAEYFHRMVEGYPRIAPYIEFLKSHPSIKIHASAVGGHTAKAMEILGLDPSRLITEISRAKIVYLPQSTPCGFAKAQATQLLARYYREYIQREFTDIEQKSVVLIQRSGERRLLAHRQVLRDLKNLSAEFGLRFEVFGDNPVPGLNDTMQVIVVNGYIWGLTYRRQNKMAINL